MFMFGACRNNWERELAGIDAVQRQQVNSGQNGQKRPGQQKRCRRPDGDFHGLARPAFTPAHQYREQYTQAEYAPGQGGLAWN